MGREERWMVHAHVKTALLQMRMRQGLAAAICGVKSEPSTGYQKVHPSGDRLGPTPAKSPAPSPALWVKPVSSSETSSGASRMLTCRDLGRQDPVSTRGCA